MTGARAGRRGELARRPARGTASDRRSQITRGATSPGPAEGTRSANPWRVVAAVSLARFAAVSLAMFMEVHDTSIANVALRDIAGGLSAADNDSEWVITGYLAAIAAVLFLSGWLSTFLGRRNDRLISVAVFTASSAACGLAGSLEQLICFRIIQGIGGGELQPATQAVLVDTSPPEEQGAAQTPFGISAPGAPVLGGTSPTTTRGLNLPDQRPSLRPELRLAPRPRPPQGRAPVPPLRFEFVGLGLIVLAMSTWEVLGGGGGNLLGLPEREGAGPDRIAAPAGLIGDPGGLPDRT